MKEQSRREFLALPAVAVGAGLCMRAAANPLGMPIGIQTYTVRKEMEKDLAGTLKQLARMGYGSVEVGDPFYGTKPAELRDMLRSLGLISPSGFYPCPKNASDWANSIEKAKKLDVEYMITTAPEGGKESLDGWRRTANFFNELGTQCKKAGLTVAYHNHNFEYRVMDGVVAYDEFLRRTDPNLVKMELDCFWTTYAGRDPLEHFETHPGRFALLHVKGLKAGFTPSTDGPKKGTNPFTDVGSGVIDYKRIFAAAPKAGVKHYFVEQDFWDGPPLEAARKSCDYLKRL